MPPAVAIIIPTLDEAAGIGAAVDHARSLADQVVVSDGGSRDDTVARARSAGARVVEGPPGRGAQLNRGAAASDAEMLIFLHADTRLPEEAAERVREAVAAGAAGGGFLVRWDSSRPIFRFGERFINLRTRLLRTPLGDQAQFATRTAFDTLGGFREWPILEDLDFMRRLKRLGRPVALTPPVVTSARRFERLGILRALTLNWLIFTFYFLGARPERLASWYRGARAPGP